MDVSVIIVNFNTTDLTRKCIDSIVRFSKEYSYEIILVDNSSEDRSIEQITHLYPTIITIFNKINLGFGAANNMGIQLAKGEFVFLLNSDTQLLSDAMKSFCEFMRAAGNEQVAICGAELVNEKNLPVTSFGNFPTLFGAFSAIGFRYFYSSYYLRKQAIGVANYNKLNKKVDFISGANLYIRASILQKIGVFDERFFLYFEETDLAYRIKKEGYILMVLPSVKIVHLEGGSSKGFNYQSYSYYYQSKQLFLKKRYGDFVATLFLPFDLFFMIFKTITNKETGNWYRKFKIIINQK